MAEALRQVVKAGEEMISPVDLVSAEKSSEQKDSDVKELRKRTLAWTEAALDLESWKKIIILRIVLDHFLYGGCNEIKNVSKLNLQTEEGVQKWQKYLRVVYPSLLHREWNIIRHGKIDGTVGEMIDHELLEFAHQAKLRGLVVDLLEGMALAEPILESFREVVGSGLADSFLDYIRSDRRRTRLQPGSDFDVE